MNNASFVCLSSCCTEGMCLSVGLGAAVTVGSDGALKDMFIVSTQSPQGWRNSVL